MVSQQGPRKKRRPSLFGVHQGRPVIPICATCNLLSCYHIEYYYHPEICVFQFLAFGKNPVTMMDFFLAFLAFFSQEFGFFVLSEQGF